MNSEQATPILLPDGLTIVPHEGYLEVRHVPRSAVRAWIIWGATVALGGVIGGLALSATTHAYCRLIF